MGELFSPRLICACTFGALKFNDFMANFFGISVQYVLHTLKRIYTQTHTICVQTIFVVVHEIAFYVRKVNVNVWVSVCMVQCSAVGMDRTNVFGILRLWNDILWKTGRIKKTHTHTLTQRQRERRVLCDLYTNMLYLNVDRNNVQKVIEASRCFIQVIKRTVIFII